MMRLSLPRRAGSMLLALALTAMLAAPAAAAAPYTERFSNAGSGQDDTLTEACGAPITMAWSQRGTYIEYADGSIRIHVNFQATYFGPGGSAQEQGAYTIHGSPLTVTIDEVTGTLTETFTDRHTGLPVKGMIPGAGVIVRDAGSVTFDVTVVFDLESGDFISFSSVPRDVRGPHPSLDRDLLGDLCDVLT